MDAVGPLSDDGLVRLLNHAGEREEHDFFSPYAADLTPQRLREFYRTMTLTRAFDMEATSLQRQGELGLWVQSWGQEAAQVGSGAVVRGDDYVFPSYREHAVALQRGVDLPQMLTIFRGLKHGAWNPADHNFHLYTLVIGAHTLHATGYAMGLDKDGLVASGDPELDHHGEERAGEVGPDQIEGGADALIAILGHLVERLAERDEAAPDELLDRGRDEIDAVLEVVRDGADGDLGALGDPTGGGAGIAVLGQAVDGGVEERPAGGGPPLRLGTTPRRRRGWVAHGDPFPQTAASVETSQVEPDRVRVTTTRLWSSCGSLSSLLRPAAAVTAPITVARKAPFSSASIPAIVVPPGLATWSFSTPGCSPVAWHMAAAPLTVCTASCIATPRGSPARTPPSARASIIMKTYAGPLPLRPVTAEVGGRLGRENRE